MSELMVLTPAGPDDVAAIARLCVAVERQHETYWPLRWQLRDDIDQRYHRWLQSNLLDPRWLILCAKTRAKSAHANSAHPGVLAGVLVAAIQEEIPIYSCGQYAFIHDMAVVEKYRHQGVGNKLLQETRHWAETRGVNQIRAMVAVANAAATALFDQATYRPTYREMVLATHCADRM